MSMWGERREGNWAIEFGSPNAAETGLSKTDFPHGTKVCSKGISRRTATPRSTRPPCTLPDGRRLFTGSADRSPMRQVAKGRGIAPHAASTPRILVAGDAPSRRLRLHPGGIAAACPVGRGRPGQGIPRTADGKPDFSGIWQTLSAADYDLEPHRARKDAPPGIGIVDGNAIPYQPGALEQRKKNFESRATADPRTKCFTLGMPRGIYYPEPFQIFPASRDVTIVHEFGHSVRRHSHQRHDCTRRAHIDFWLGDSRGRWEGDTLVVDVTHFNDETWLDSAGNFHSDALHVVERWSFLDANTIDYQATLEDSKVFTRPWSLRVQLHRHREPNFQLIENYCYTLDYDEFYPYPKEATR